MKFYPSFRTILPALLLLSIVSCKKESGQEATEEQSLDALLNPPPSARMLETKLQKSVHSATARYNSTVQALKAGYVPDNNCVSVPGLGGMGYHWVKASLIDPVFDPLQPEALLYAKDAKGKMRLIAVEYLVIDAGQPRPMFGDQLFDIGSGAPIPVSHWSLHAWIHEENPAGMFKPFNPNITCN